MKVSCLKRTVILVFISLLTISCGKSNDEWINNFVAEMEAKLPIKLSEEMALTAVEPGNDEIFIIYTFSGDDELITDEYLSELKLYFLEKTKTQKGKQQFLKRGIRFTYRVENVKREELTSFSIGKNDLNM